MKIFQYELSDLADYDDVKEIAVELVVRYDDWIMGHDIVTAGRSSYLVVQYWNGREAVWQRMYEGDTFTFFGEPSEPIPGFPHEPLVAQVATGPQQLAAEAMLGDLMGGMGLPSPTELFHSMNEGTADALVDGMDAQLQEAMDALRELMTKKEDDELDG